MDVVTDGELRRHTFIDQLLEAVEGLTPDPEGSASDHIPVPFYDEGGTEQSVFTIPISVTDKIRRKRMMTVEEYAYARARARKPVKVTLPSPLMLFLAWSPGRSRDAYADPFELFADGLTLMREEAQELARMGCPYIQIDAPDFGQLIDPSQQTAVGGGRDPVRAGDDRGRGHAQRGRERPRRHVRAAHLQGQLRQSLDQRRRVRVDRRPAVPAPQELRPDPARVRERALRLVRAAQGAARTTRSSCSASSPRSSTSSSRPSS